MKLFKLFIVLAILSVSSIAFADSLIVGRYYKSTATGSGAVSTTVAPGVDWRLDSIRIHLSAAGGAGDFTATLDANAGAAYDVVVLTQDMTSVTDLVWFPDRDLIFTSGDELDLAWTNGSSRTYGIEVYYVKVD